MASAPDEVAKNIARNIIPFKGGEDLQGAYGQAENIGLKLLRQLGLLPMQAQGAPGMAPPMNAPLPKYNPLTGGIDYPPGYQGRR